MLNDDALPVNHNAAVQVHLSLDDSLSDAETMVSNLDGTHQRIVIRCSAMPIHASATSRLQRILLMPQFTDITVLLSNGVNQLPLEVFSTVFASRNSIEHLQFLASGRTTSLDGLVALLRCWKMASGQQHLPRLTVGCTWHHPRSATQSNRLNHALLDLEDCKIGHLKLEKLVLRTIPRFFPSVELCHCQTSTYPMGSNGPKAFVLQPLPPALPCIVHWLKDAGSYSHRLGLDVYRLTPYQMKELLEVAAKAQKGKHLAILGVRHTHHMQTLIDMLPQFRVAQLEVEYIDHPYIKWPTPALVQAVQGNWRLESLTLRGRTQQQETTSPCALLDGHQTKIVQHVLQRNKTLAGWDHPDPQILGYALQQCTDPTVAASWLLQFDV